MRHCWQNLTISQRVHATRNGKAKVGYHQKLPDWQPGEQARLIAEALEAGKATKCPNGYTLDQGTLGLTEIKL
jgi:hypothetical protein